MNRVFVIFWSFNSPSSIIVHVCSFYVCAVPVCIAGCTAECILQERSLHCIECVIGWRVAGPRCTSRCEPAPSEVYCYRELQETHKHRVCLETPIQNISRKHTLYLKRCGLEPRETRQPYTVNITVGNRELTEERCIPRAGRSESCSAGDALIAIVPCSTTPGSTLARFR